MGENTNEVPRRLRLDQMFPAELAVVAAVQEIEKLPPDLRLTEALNLLHKAKERIADFFDNKKPLLNSDTEKIEFEKWKTKNGFYKVGLFWHAPQMWGVYTDDDLHTAFLNDFFKQK